MNAEKQKTILLVENEVIIAMAEKMTLEKFGYAVIIAITGEEAIEIIEKNPAIDLILMDIDLGSGIDGTEAAALILQQRDLPIVFLSGHTEPEIIALTEKITSYGFLVKNSNAAVFQALIKMVFKLFESISKEKKRASQRDDTLESLRESEERFHSFFDNANAGIYRTAPDGSIHLANPALIRMLGYSSFADLGEKDLNKTGFEPSYPRTQFIAKIEKDGEVKGLESAWKRKDGGTIIVRESARAIRDAGGKTLFYDGIVEDISEIKRSEAALQKSEMQRKAMLENSPVVILLIQEGKLIYMNPAAEKITGWQKEEFIGKNFASFVHKDDMEIAVKNNRERMGGNSFLAPYALRIIKKTGDFIYVEINGTVIDLDGKPTMLGFLTDISERKRAEEEIKRQLAEKEVLLREIHHRIKNNIASISGLLSLRLRSIANPEAAAALHDAIGRVDSMGLLYEKLMLSETHKVVSVKIYAESLIDMVVAQFQGDTRIALDKRIDDFPLDPKRLFPLGIIINELLTNIMKYAFNGRKTGSIQFSLARADGRVTLTLQDDGQGLPPGFDAERAEGFGLMLVKMLCRQLAGRFSIENRAGTRCVVQFNA